MTAEEYIASRNYTDHETLIGISPADLAELLQTIEELDDRLRWIYKLNLRTRNADGTPIKAVFHGATEPFKP